MSQEIRISARDRGQAPPGKKSLGTQRYQRYLAAFKRVERCLEEGFHLEAIAILDSLIGDRLASRLAYLLNKESNARWTVGGLCHKLLNGAETDSAFRACAEQIRGWTERRNRAMHATAKILRRVELTETFEELLQAHRGCVIDGIELLREFDELDTAARKANDAPKPATWPGAFSSPQNPEAVGRA